MPMYEFLCGSCEKDFETIVSSSDAADRVECPECGSKKVHKKLSLFAKSTSGAAASASASTFSGYSAGGGGCGGMCSCH